MLPFNPYPKSVQLYNNRQKLTRRQRSELTPKEDKRLKDRSGGICEKCKRLRAVERAHIERRWKSERRPTAEDFVHLCKGCHIYCDGSAEGRKWLWEFQSSLVGRV